MPHSDATPSTYRYKVDFSEMTSIDDDEDEFYGSDDDSGMYRLASVPYLSTAYMQRYLD